MDNPGDPANDQVPPGLKVRNLTNDEHEAIVVTF